jgi:branched-chain amino acid transport system substrate-binding protein
MEVIMSLLSWGRQLACPAIVAASALVSTGALAQEPIKIGMAAALTGPAAPVGVDIRRGAEIAVDEINAKGGIKGRKVVLIARDDEHNPVKTRTSWSTPWSRSSATPRSAC